MGFLNSKTTTLLNNGWNDTGISLMANVKYFLEKILELEWLDCIYHQMAGFYAIKDK